MKNVFRSVLALVASTTFSLISFAQTAGTLTFTYTPTSHTGYSGTKNVLAIWIQDQNNAFVKTKMRYVGSQTKDHLPTWAVNSGGTAGNALSANCNIVSATTGATLPNFTTKTITWDGTDVNGNVVADGVYKVTIQSTWDHNGGTATRSFTFNKGAVTDSPSFANDANFTAISLNWVPTAAGVEENAVANFNVYPVPSTDGLLTVNFEKASAIKVIDLQGKVIIDEPITENAKTYSLNMSSYENGTYLVIVTDGATSYQESIVLAK